MTVCQVTVDFQLQGRKVALLAVLMEKAISLLPDSFLFQLTKTRCGV